MTYHVILTGITQSEIIEVSDWCKEQFGQIRRIDAYSKKLSRWNLIRLGMIDNIHITIAVLFTYKNDATLFRLRRT